jgi:hypothetical protein
VQTSARELAPRQYSGYPLARERRMVMQGVSTCSSVYEAFTLEFKLWQLPGRTYMLAKRSDIWVAGFIKQGGESLRLRTLVIR